MQTNSDNGAPKAYLNWLVFDRNYLFVTGGFKQITTAAKEAGSDVAHERVFNTSPILITQPGYVYIYLSNEAASPVEVFFDDFKVTHTKSPVIQQDDYYPFGLTFNSYQRENSTPKQYKFNGIEEQDELGLNVSQAFFRTMDPTIGRWWQIDPKVDDYYQVSPYNMMANNPINITDPLGDEWVDPKKDGKIAAQINSGLDRANASLKKQNTKLDGQIAKASAKGKTDKVNSLTAQKNSNTQAIGINNQSKAHLEYMASTDQGAPKFTFIEISGNTGGTNADSNTGIVTMEVTNSLGNKVHEVRHGWDKSPSGNHDQGADHTIRLEEGPETRAYQAQYAADPNSMPGSIAPGRLSNVNSVNGVYVGGIMKTDKNGNLTNSPQYERTYKKYKQSQSYSK